MYHLLLLMSRMCFMFPVCLQVFDVTRKITYKNLPNWFAELRQYRPEIPCLCAANKIDGKS